MIRECDTGELAARLNVDGRRLPIDGMIELTARCNLGCVHCYVNEPVHAPAVQARELSTARMVRLVAEIADAGGLFLTLSGGEVFVRPDFPELYLAAIRAGLIVSVFTNGTMVTERLVDLFDENRPHQIEITLYGATRETYERVTGVPGSFDRCMSGVRRLVARGIDVRLKTMVMTLNAHEVAEMKAISDELGRPFRFDGHLNPRVDCGRSRYKELQVDVESFFAVETQFLERFDEMRGFMETRKEAVPLVYECGAGQTGYTIEASGRLLLCELSRKRGVDLHTKTFSEAWEELGGLRGGELPTTSPCRTCNIRALCGSCAGANEMENGDPQQPVPLFCQITHRRAAELWEDALGHRADASCCLTPRTTERLIRLEPRRRLPQTA